MFVKIKISFYFISMHLCRYLKRGVNEKGRVANDVETEQIVFTEARDGHPMQISSVVQNRGSIPLFWSQETSRLNIKPDIICMIWKQLSSATYFVLKFVLITHCLYFSLVSRKDSTFEATRLHFDNLVKRYGKPIIILNLIKVGFSIYVTEPLSKFVFFFISLDQKIFYLIYSFVFSV